MNSFPFRRWVSIATVALSLVACSQPTSSTATTSVSTGSIAGKAVFNNASITDQSGIVISLESTSGGVAASVLRASEARSVSGGRSVTAQTTTAADGSYSLSSVAPGTYTVYASSSTSDQVAYTTGVTVTAGQSVSVTDLSLTAVGTIQGAISVGSATTGLSGYIVSVAGTSFMASTADNGSFTISGVPVGTGYSLLVTYNGCSLAYRSAAVDVTVAGVTLATASFGAYDFQTASTSGNFQISAKSTGIVFWNLNVPAASTVTIVETKTGLQYVRTFSAATNWTQMTFPFVTAGNSYTFSVTCANNGNVYYRDYVRVTATAGLGELTATAPTLSYSASANTVTSSSPVLSSSSGYTILTQSSDMTVYEGPVSDGVWVYQLVRPSTSSSFNAFALTTEPTLATNGWRSGTQVNAFLAGHTFHVDYSLRFTVSGFESGYFCTPVVNSSLFTYTDTTVKNVAVTWDANGGSGAPATSSVAYGQKLVEPTTIPTRTGYTFLGWSTSSTSTVGDSFPAQVAPVAYISGSGTPLFTLTYYALWQSNS